MNFTFVCEKYGNINDFLEQCKLETSGKTREVVDSENKVIEFGFVLENCRVVSVSKEYRKAAVEVPAEVREVLRNMKFKLFEECEPFMSGGVFSFKIPESEAGEFAERIKKNMYVKAQFKFRSVFTFQGAHHTTFVVERICETEAPFTPKEKTMFDW